MKAKSLSLQDQTGATRSLAEFAGKYVVLYFYPKDFTSGCTTEACDFRDASDELRSLGAVVLGVSKDTVASHAKFDAKHGLGFTLLSDPDLAVTKSFGAFGTKSMYGKVVEGVKRSTFLIGPNGELVREWVGVKVPGHVQAVRAAIEAHRAGGSAEAAGEDKPKREAKSASAKAKPAKKGR